MEAELKGETQGRVGGQGPVEGVRLEEVRLGEGGPQVEVRGR